MATGTAKWFNDSKGFGFVTPEDGGKDLFAQVTIPIDEFFPEFGKTDFVFWCFNELQNFRRFDERTGESPHWLGHDGGLVDQVA